MKNHVILILLPIISLAVLALAGCGADSQVVTGGSSFSESEPKKEADSNDADRTSPAMSASVAPPTDTVPADGAANAPQTEPPTAPVTVTVTEPISDPVTDPVTEPVTMPLTEPPTEPVTAPATDAASEPNDVEYPYSDSLLPQIYINTESEIARTAYVACSVTVRDPSGKYEDVTDTQASVKIRGNSTASGEKKPYNVKFSFKAELLDVGKGKKWCLLANLYDKTQLRNAIAFSFAKAAGVPYVSDYCFAEVYLNGEYRGLYQLTEPVGVSKTRVDINIDENDFLLEKEPWAGYSNPASIYLPATGLVLGYNEPEEPTDEQRERLADLMNKVESALTSGDYAAIAEVIDLNSFAASYVVQELFKNVDYATSSTRFFVKDGLLYEGPVWDFDLSSGNCSYWYYSAYNNAQTSGLSYEGLWTVGNFNIFLFNYPEFTELVRDTLAKLTPEIEELYRDGGVIDRLVEQHRREIDRNNGLWSTQYAYGPYEHSPADGTYEGEITYLKHWLEQRAKWLSAYYLTDEAPKSGQ